MYRGDGQDPVKIAQEGIQDAIDNLRDVVIIDTAGRLHAVSYTHLDVYKRQVWPLAPLALAYSENLTIFAPRPRQPLSLIHI